MINFFDIGANNGAIVGIIKNVLDKLSVQYKIYAFEPDPESFIELQKNWGSDGHCELLNLACSDWVGGANLYKSSVVGGDSLHITKHNVDPNKFISVKVIKFSDWFKLNIDGKNFNIVKINTEGSEYEIYKDIISSGVVDDINVFCGSLGDIYKIGKSDSEINAFLKYLEDHNVVVHELSGGRISGLDVILEMISRTSSAPESIPELEPMPQPQKDEKWFSEEGKNTKPSKKPRAKRKSKSNI